MKDLMPLLIYSWSVRVRQCSSYTIYNLRATKLAQKCILLAGKHSQISPCGNNFSTLNKIYFVSSGPTNANPVTLVRKFPQYAPQVSVINCLTVFVYLYTCKLQCHRCFSYRRESVLVCWNTLRGSC